MGAGSGNVCEPFPRGDANLLLDQVEARDLFRNCVLDLQARVDFQEAHAPVALNEELARSEPLVSDGVKQSPRPVDQCIFHPVGKRGSGGFLNELLVSALHRAIAGGDYRKIPEGVASALGFNVAGGADETLDEKSVGMMPVRREKDVKVRVGFHNGDSTAAAAVGFLRYNRESVVGDKGVDDVTSGNRVGQAGHRLNSHRLGKAASLDFVPERVENLRGRADPRHSRVEHRPGEFRDFGEESVSGMDGVGLCFTANLQ